jgi:CheY-like chemotaxis protein
MKAVVAQESRVVRSFLRAALRPTRYAAAETLDLSCGGDLLRFLKGNEDPDTLILLDWNLPGLDVPTLLRHLGKRGTIDRVAILLCVNSRQVPLAEQAVRQGARGFITRPYSDEDLSAKIEEIGRTYPAPSVPAGDAVLQDMATTLRVREELPPLLGLPSGLIARLFEHTQRTRHEPGSVILAPGDLVDALPFVTAGDVEIQSAEGPGTRITRGAGECFAERAFVCGEPAKLSVRALTAVEVAAVPKESVVELARRHPALQDFLTFLLSRPSVPEAEGEPELAGTVASLPFSDLLQFLNSTRKTGVLILEDKGCLGRIYFERGEVCDARVEDKTGEGAFFSLARWQEARFDFRAGASSGARTIHHSTMKLLMNSFLQSQPQESPDSALCAKVG